MEALTLVFDTLVILIVVYQGLRDDRRAPAAGLFRYRDVASPEETKAPAPQETDFAGARL